MCRDSISLDRALAEFAVGHDVVEALARRRLSGVVTERGTYRVTLAHDALVAAVMEPRR
jgi:hypothetical protein